MKNNYFNKLKNEKFIFYDEPIYHKKEDYTKITNKIRKKYKNNTNIKKVYQFGFVSVPGISDIDIIIILKNKSKSIKKDECEIWGFA